jgi:hypothetical protein
MVMLLSSCCSFPFSYLVSVEQVRKVSYADAVRGTGTHPESDTVDDAVHWHVVKSRRNKERIARLSASHSLK